MRVEMTRTKCAVIREPGYPVGKPAPCYINCRCGAKPRTDHVSDVLCDCGTLYNATGWLIGRVTQDDKTVQAAFDS